MEVKTRSIFGREPMECVAGEAIIRRGWGFFCPGRLHQKANTPRRS